MSTRTAPGSDLEEIRTTRSETLLAIVLAVFLLIGAAWVYDRLGDVATSAIADPVVAVADEAAVQRLDDASLRAEQAAGEERLAEAQLVTARETYRTELDADRPAERLRLAYVQRQRELDAARGATQAARAEVAAAQPAATAARARVADDQQAASDRRALLAFALRLVSLLGLLGSGIWLLGRWRRSGSRWFPLSFSLVGTATILALYFAGDYVTDYVDPLELGPLVLSLVGIGLTLVGFAALQRYLTRRAPGRRVRKGECPSCGYPAGSGEHCEGCGRAIVAECTSCTSPRRVGTPHCRACGAT